MMVSPWASGWDTGLFLACSVFLHGNVQHAVDELEVGQA